MGSLKKKYQEYLDRFKKMKDKALKPLGSETNPDDPLALKKSSGGGGSAAQEAEKALKDY